MKTLKSKRDYVVKRAVELHACQGQVDKASAAKTLDELIEVVRNNAGWVSENKMLTDEISIELFGLSVSNLLNSGNCNSGYRNSGDRNSGNCNSGDSNSGNCNSGYRNSGDRNSGNWNSGYRNSGDSNSGYRNSGAFCTDPNPKAILFNRPSILTVKEWEQHEACRLMNGIDFTIWVPGSLMSEQDKSNWPKWETTDGFLKTIPHKEAWSNFWNNLAQDKRDVFKSIPNFDAAIFQEITGITV